jgi:hypothetical protein
VTGHGAKFETKMEAAIAALLTSPNLAEAAKAAGIGESTLKRWLKDETFSARYREERARLLENTTTLLRSKSMDAVTVLVNLSNNRLTPPAVRVSAARSIIALGFAAEMCELEERLAQLEDLARERT